MNVTSLEIISEGEEYFCQLFVKTGIAAYSARKSGFTKVDAGYRLMKKKKIRARILELKKEMQGRVDEDSLLSKYTTDVAMEESEQAMEFARGTRNATAFGKAVELRARMAGHLVEKIDIRAQVGFSINIVGINRQKPEARDLLDSAPILEIPETTEQLEIPAFVQPIDYQPIDSEIDDSGIFDEDERRKELFS